MVDCFVSETKDKIISIEPICKNDFAKWLETQSSQIKNLVVTNNFNAIPNTFCLIADQNGDLEKVLLGIETNNDFFAFGVLSKALPTGTYRIESKNFTTKQFEHAAIGWGLGSYQFTHYKKLQSFGAKLLYNENYDLIKIKMITAATFWVRDLINIPAGDLYPEKLAEIAQNLAKEFNAKFNKISGDDLREDFPAIYAVGYGSKKKPLLIDLCFGDEGAPKVVLVGKGVCFDSGGLDLKSAQNMLQMKKDMAGAAHALGLARMIMTAKLPINLRVIIPAVENLISGDSLKPGDVIKTRKGLTIEVANTDAEGRLILADALTLASEWNPELILDFATLTGAARVALGSDIVALFSSNDLLAKDIIETMTEEQEPVWQMPLYQPYLEILKSDIADFKNCSTSDHPTGGAITAALMLQQFVAPKIKWAHFDMNAYNDESKPGKPQGGEAECLRGVFKYLEQTFLIKNIKNLSSKTKEKKHAII